jgi:hypothetical protein
LKAELKGSRFDTIEVIKIELQASRMNLKKGNGSSTGNGALIFIFHGRKVNIFVAK